MSSILGAGASIDSFWHVYKFHQEQKTLNILENYRIGNLRAEDRTSEVEIDPYDNEPVRNCDLDVKIENPFNAETPLSVLVNNFITPVEYFYGNLNCN